MELMKYVSEATRTMFTLNERLVLRITNDNVRTKFGLYLMNTMGTYLHKQMDFIADMTELGNSYKFLHDHYSTLGALKSFDEYTAFIDKVNAELKAARDREFQVMKEKEMLESSGSEMPPASSTVAEPVRPEHIPSAEAVEETEF